MRVLFHYTHKQTLGHTTRSVALAAALCRQDAELLVLQGGVPQPFIHFPQDCRVLDIPFPFDTRASFQSLAVPVNATKRAKFILQTAAEFSPDVFITEFFPFGRMMYIPEFLPVLRYLRKKGTRIMASIGYPLLIDLDRLKDRQFAALHRAVFAFFDTFLIHTPDDTESRYIQATMQPPALSSLYTACLQEIKERIVYTGYILPEKMMSGGADWPAETVTGSKTILVSRGGGAVYPKLMTTAIEAQDRLGDDTRTVIACGPATSPEEMALFESLLKSKNKERVFLTEYIADLGNHLNNCCVSVSLCGYNTSVQLMRHGMPSVIVPYQNKKAKMPTNDQIARARLLQEKFASTILEYDTLTGRSLADAVTKQLASPRPVPAPADWFNGADAAARYIVQNLS